MISKWNLKGWDYEILSSLHKTFRSSPLNFHILILESLEVWEFHFKNHALWTQNGIFIPYSENGIHNAQCKEMYNLHKWYITGTLNSKISWQISASSKFQTHKSLTLNFDSYVKLESRRKYLLNVEAKHFTRNYNNTQNPKVIKNK